MFSVQIFAYFADNHYICIKHSFILSVVPYFFAMTIDITLDQYLAQWFIHEFGGTVPVKLPRGSVESAFLLNFLTTPPKDWQPPARSDDTVTIQLPAFSAKDTRYHFYLTSSAVKALVELIRARFDLQLWNELHDFHNMFRRKDNLIYAFMEKHGIECNETNWNAVAKRYQRKCDVYRKIRRKKDHDQKE